MGNLGYKKVPISQSFSPAFQNRNKRNNSEIEQKNQNGNIDLKGIPDDQFLCPKCAEVPEILNIHTDNGCIELKCKHHGKQYLNLREYYEKTKNSSFTYFKTICSQCNAVQKTKENMFKYCYYCKKDFCNNCVNKFDHADVNHTRNHLDVCIPVNEKNNRCLEHYNEDITDYCYDCQEAICDKESTRQHRGHRNRISLFKLGEDINKYINIIQEKNKILSDIITFNQIIINTFTKFQNNYYHIMSVINLGKSLEKETQRDTKEINYMIDGLEKSFKIQKEAIETLQKKFRLTFNGEEKKLELRERKLGSEGFKLISKINFNQLIDMNISGNGIQNLEPLNNMNLPYLKYCDLSENEIIDIEPIRFLNCKKIRELCLQNNKIKKLSPLLDTDFKELQILRIENNSFDKSLKEFKQVLKKYTKDVVIYMARTPEEFDKKYNCHICKDFDKTLKNIDTVEIMNLSSIKGGDEMIKELYLIIPYKNKIKKLCLDNNKIENISLLSRIPLPKIQVLDLSMNDITNLNFLNDMKLDNLKEIYLNDNKINDIYPLINLRCNNEKDKNVDGLIISLKGNNLKVDDKQSKMVAQTLIERNVTLDLKPK